MTHERSATVSGEQKMQAKKEQAKGKAKEAAGRAVGNERLTAKGRAEQVKGDTREAKEKIKDAMKD
ncbi:CsbD family protein [Streptomyces sp. NPDC059875]|uniref:CsbD family protein n=1 Tax=unclassified Streptomyces TaxID=2593676 RepID=UPI00365B2D05